MGFDGQRVWITGASSGIGEAAAHAFAAQGARVVLSARREARLEAVRAALPDPSRHVVVPLDMARPDDFAAATVQAGPVDVLVLNAGISQRAFMLQTDPADERRLMEVNYFGPIGLTRQVLPGMLSRGRGRLVVVTSMMGRFASPMRTSYCASKHALHGYFDALRAELAGAGVTVTLFCPGFVKTSLPGSAVGPDGGGFSGVDPEIEAGLPPARVAARLLDATAQGAREVHVGGTERLGVLLKAFAPGVLASVLARRAERQGARAALVSREE